MKGLPRIAWVGLALLALASIMLSLGKRETQSFPAADSFAPSGAAALAALLQQQGYQVDVDRSLRPKLAQDDLVIAFELPEPASFLGEVQKELETESEEVSSELDKPFNKEILEHLSAGGKAIFLPLTRDFLAASKTVLSAEPVELLPVIGGPPLQANLAGPEVPVRKATQELIDNYTVARLWVDKDGSALVDGVRVGSGTAFVLSNGIIGTNRFIDRADNAALLLKLVSVVAPKGSRIVFTEASFGNVQNKGFLETIGAWADAAWQQLLLLGLVVVYTLGKRLGLAEEQKTKQRGSRELVDALADTMNRANATELAMNTALRRTDAELRIALKLPKDIERIRRDELLSPDLRTAMADLEAAALDKDTSSHEAARRVDRVDREMSTFLGGRRPGIARKS